jgi:hypothetical protein
MARGTDPDSATSQFYICDGPQHGLDNGNRTLDDDPGYAVFGVVREGIELVQAAAGVPTTNDADGDGSIPRVPGGPDRPLYEVHINSITIREYVSAPVVEKTDSEKTPALYRIIFGLIAVAAIAGFGFWSRMSKKELVDLSQTAIRKVQRKGK